MLWQFHMIIGHAIDRHLRDRAAIDQRLCRDQHRVDIHGMVGRQPKIAAWLAGTERAREDAYWPDLVRCRMARAVHVTMTDPAHRFRLVVQCHLHTVADAQFLHRDLATFGADPCPADEARDSTGGQHLMGECVRRQTEVGGLIRT